MQKSSYQRHPSPALNKLYEAKSHQGANPETASVYFIGRDPNWAADVEQMPMFHKVDEYLNDGVSFWQRNKVHHPFLLPNYKGDGKRYHTIFSKMNIPSLYAHQISFLELIGFPTTGMAKKDNKSFMEHLFSIENSKHLKQLDTLLNDESKLIFMAWGLMDDFKTIHNKTGLFKKFASLNKEQMNIKELNVSNNINVHRHFSDAISNDTIFKMENKVKKFLL